MAAMRDSNRNPIYWHDDKAEVEPTGEPQATGPQEPSQDRHGGRHALMMLACCIPMVLVVIALVATGVAGAGAVAYALLCIGMMAAMMLLMPGHRH